MYNKYYIYVPFSVLEFHFTTLSATGKEGPTSNTGYKGTSLENVNVTNGLQKWWVPFTGWYYIDMCGASGADAPFINRPGGKGARVNGTVHLEEGTELVVLVGQQGLNDSYSGGDGGGGGGSFVVFASNSTPLSIAGGGGRASAFYDGGPGQAGEAEGLKNGTVGQGGLACVARGYHPERDGGPGGGLSGDGKCCKGVSCNMTEGKSFLNGGSGGTGVYKFRNGGFGGGGSAGQSHGGGGGGYSRGSAIGSGWYVVNSGGGGSYIPSNHGNKWSAKTGVCDKGDGYVTVRFKGP